MSAKVTMTSIANKLGVSKNTVSLALRGVGGISESTRRLIIDTADALGYRYKSAAKQGESRNLCLVIPKSAQNSLDFFSVIQMGIEDEAKKNNINTVLHYYDDTGNGFQIPLCIREGMISGIITLGRVDQSTVQTLKSYGLPVIMVDNYIDGMEIDCILTDNYCGGYTAAEHLIRSGHKSIAFFGEIKASVSFYDRYMGYRRAVERYGVDIPEQSSLLLECSESIWLDDAIALIRQVQATGGLPSAFVCCNDITAILLCKALNQLNISVPGQISVVGFDDISAASGIIPELTTMQVRREAMGRKAVVKLLSRLSGGDGIAEKILLSARLIERDSVKSPM